MGNKKEGIPKGVFSPALNVGAGTIERAIKNIQGNEIKPDYKQTYNLSSLNKEKRIYLLFVPESGPTDNQLYEAES